MKPRSEGENSDETGWLCTTATPQRNLNSLLDQPYLSHQCAPYTQPLVSLDGASAERLGENKFEDSIVLIPVDEVTCFRAADLKWCWGGT